MRLVAQHGLRGAARVLRAGDAALCDAETAAQVASIEAATLRAPPGLHDDRALAFVLALAARRLELVAAPSHTLAPADLLAAWDASGDW